MRMTQEELKKLLCYDPNTGVFTNRIDRGAKARVDKPCGTIRKDGYLSVSIDNKLYLLHRLAFLYMPEHHVDHMNGVVDDNMWSNLRHVSQSCNRQNCKKSITNKAGFSGVCWDKHSGKWLAQARVNKKQINLGHYLSLLEAALARLTWEVQCSEWHCDCQGTLVKQIQKAWPQFNLKSLQ